MNIEQARGLSLENFIKQLGYREVQKGRSYEAWFNSPLRDEKSPSFKVDRNTNKWIDFGEDKKRSDIIDFVKIYGERRGWGTLTTSQALERIASISGESPKISRPTRQREFTSKIGSRDTKSADTFRIDLITPLQSKELIDYLRLRRLRITPAKDVLQQIHYTHVPSQRQFYGLTWANEQGGQEVRSANFKAVIGPKAPSVIDVNHPKTAPGTAVFEGVTDYLSYLQLARKEVMSRAIIMNSTNTYKEVIELVKNQPEAEPVRGYLQNDRAGLVAAYRLKQGIPGLDLKNHLYSAYADVNDYLTGKPMLLADKQYAVKVLGSDLRNDEGVGTVRVGKGRSIS